MHSVLVKNMHSLGNSFFVHLHKMHPFKRLIHATFACYLATTIVCSQAPTYYNSLTTVPEFRDTYQAWGEIRYSASFWEPYVNAYGEISDSGNYELVPNVDEFYFITTPESGNKLIQAFDYTGTILPLTFTVPLSAVCYPSIDFRIVCSTTSEVEYYVDGTRKVIEFGGLEVYGDLLGNSLCPVHAVSLGNRVIFRHCSGSVGDYHLSLVFLIIESGFASRTAPLSIPQLNHVGEIHFDGTRYWVSYYDAAYNKLLFYEITVNTNADGFDWNTHDASIPYPNPHFFYIHESHGIISGQDGVMRISNAQYFLPGSILRIPLAFGDFMYTVSEKADDLSKVCISILDFSTLAHSIPNICPDLPISMSNFVVDATGVVCIFFGNAPAALTVYCFKGTLQMDSHISHFERVNTSYLLEPTGFVSPYGDIFLASSAGEIVVFSGRGLLQQEFPPFPNQVWNWDAPSGYEMVMTPFPPNCSPIGNILITSTGVAYARLLESNVVYIDFEANECMLTSISDLSVLLALEEDSSDTYLYGYDTYGYIQKYTVDAASLISDVPIGTPIVGFTPVDAILFEGCIAIVGHQIDTPVIHLVRRDAPGQRSYVLASIEAYCQPSKNVLFIVQNDNKVFRFEFPDPGPLGPTETELFYINGDDDDSDIVPVSCVPLNVDSANQVVFLTNRANVFMLYTHDDQTAGFFNNLAISSPPQFVPVGPMLYYLCPIEDTIQLCGSSIHLLEPSPVVTILLPLSDSNVQLRYLGGSIMAVIKGNCILLVDLDLEEVRDVHTFHTFDEYRRHPIVPFYPKAGHFELFVSTDDTSPIYRISLQPRDHKMLTTMESQFTIMMPTMIHSHNLAIGHVPQLNVKFLGSPVFCGDAIYHLCEIHSSTKLCITTSDNFASNDIDGSQFTLDPDCRVVTAAVEEGTLMVSTSANPGDENLEYPDLLFAGWTGAFHTQPSMYASSNCLVAFYKEAGECSARIWSRLVPNTSTPHGIPCDAKPLRIDDFVFIGDEASQLHIIDMRMCDFHIITLSMPEIGQRSERCISAICFFYIVQRGDSFLVFLKSIDSTSYLVKNGIMPLVYFIPPSTETFQKVPVAVFSGSRIFYQENETKLHVYASDDISELPLSSFAVQASEIVRPVAFWLSSQQVFVLTSSNSMASINPETLQLQWHFPFAVTNSCGTNQGTSSFEVFPMDDRFFIYIQCGEQVILLTTTSSGHLSNYGTAHHGYQHPYSLDFVATHNNQAFPKHQLVHDEEITISQRLSPIPEWMPKRDLFAPILTPNGILITFFADSPKIVFIDSSTGVETGFVTLHPFLELKCVTLSKSGRYLLYHYLTPGDMESVVLLDFEVPSFEDIIHWSFDFPADDDRRASVITSMSVMRNGLDTFLVDIPSGAILPEQYPTDIDVVWYPFTWSLEVGRIPIGNAVYIPSVDGIVVPINDYSVVKRYFNGGPSIDGEGHFDGRVVHAVVLVDSEVCYATKGGTLKILRYDLSYPESSVLVNEGSSESGLYINSNVALTSSSEIVYQSVDTIQILKNNLVPSTSKPYECPAGSWISTDCLNRVVILCRDGSKICWFQNDSDLNCSTLFDSGFFRSNGAVSPPVFDPKNGKVFFTTKNKMVLGYDFLGKIHFIPRSDHKYIQEILPFRGPALRYAVDDTGVATDLTNARVLTTFEFIYILRPDRFTVRLLLQPWIIVKDFVLAQISEKIFASLSSSEFLVCAQYYVMDNISSTYTQVYDCRSAESPCIPVFGSIRNFEIVSDPVYDEASGSVIYLYRIGDTDFGVLRDFGVASAPENLSFPLVVDNNDITELVSILLDEPRRLVHISIRSGSGYTKLVFSIEESLMEVTPRFVSSDGSLDTRSYHIALHPAGPLVIPYDGGYLINRGQVAVTLPDSTPIHLKGPQGFLVPDGTQSDVYYLNQYSEDAEIDQVFELNLKLNQVQVLNLPGFPQQLHGKINRMQSLPDGNFLFVIDPSLIVCYSRVLQSIVWYYSAPCEPCIIVHASVDQRGNVLYVVFDESNEGHVSFHTITLSDTMSVPFSLMYSLKKSNAHFDKTIPLIKNRNIATHSPMLTLGDEHGFIFQLPDGRLGVHDSYSGNSWLRNSEMQWASGPTVRPSGTLFGVYGDVAPEAVYYHSGKVYWTYADYSDSSNDNIVLTKDGHILACYNDAIVYSYILNGIASGTLIYADGVCPKIVGFHELSGAVYLARVNPEDGFEILVVYTFVEFDEANEPEPLFSHESTNIWLQPLLGGRVIMFMDGNTLYRYDETATEAMTSVQCSREVTVASFRLAWEDDSVQGLTSPAGLILECSEYLEYYPLDPLDASVKFLLADFALEEPLVQLDVINPGQVLVVNSHSVYILSLPLLTVDFFWTDEDIADITGAYVVDEDELLIAHRHGISVDLSSLFLGEDSNSERLDTAHGDAKRNWSNTTYVSPKDILLCPKIVQVAPQFTRFHPITFNSRLWWLDSNDKLYAFDLQSESNVMELPIDGGMTDYRIALGGFNAPSHHLHIWEHLGSRLVIVDASAGVIIKDMTMHGFKFIGPPMYFYQNSNLWGVIPDGCALRAISSGNILIELPRVAQGMIDTDTGPGCTAEPSGESMIVPPTVMQRNVGTPAEPDFKDIIVVAVNGCPFMHLYDVYFNLLTTIPCPGVGPTSPAITSQYAVVSEDPDPHVFFTTMRYLYRLSLKTLQASYISVVDLTLTSYIAMQGGNVLVAASNNMLYSYGAVLNTKAVLASPVLDTILCTGDTAVWYIGKDNHLYVIYNDVQVSKYYFQTAPRAGPFALSDNKIMVQMEDGSLYIFTPLETQSIEPNAVNNIVASPYLQRILPLSPWESQLIEIDLASGLAKTKDNALCFISDERLSCISGSMKEIFRSAESFGDSRSVKSTPTGDIYFCYGNAFAVLRFADEPVLDHWDFTVNGTALPCSDIVIFDNLVVIASGDSLYLFPIGTDDFSVDHLLAKVGVAPEDVIVTLDVYSIGYDAQLNLQYLMRVQRLDTSHCILQRSAGAEVDVRCYDPTGVSHDAASFFPPYGLLFASDEELQIWGVESTDNVMAFAAPSSPSNFVMIQNELSTTVYFSQDGRVYYYNGELHHTNLYRYSAMRGITTEALIGILPDGQMHVLSIGDTIPQLLIKVKFLTPLSYPRTTPFHMLPTGSIATTFGGVNRLSLLVVPFAADSQCRVVGCQLANRATLRTVGFHFLPTVFTSPCNNFPVQMGASFICATTGVISAWDVDTFDYISAYPPIVCNGQPVNLVRLFNDQLLYSCEDVLYLVTDLLVADNASPVAQCSGEFDIRRFFVLISGAFVFICDDGQIRVGDVMDRFSNDFDVGQIDNETIFLLSSETPNYELDEPNSIGEIGEERLYILSGEKLLIVNPITGNAISALSDLCDNLGQPGCTLIWAALDHNQYNIFLVIENAGQYYYNVFLPDAGDFAFSTSHNILFLPGKACVLSSNTDADTIVYRVKAYLYHDVGTLSFSLLTHSYSNGEPQSPAMITRTTYSFNTPNTFPTFQNIATCEGTPYVGPTDVVYIVLFCPAGNVLFLTLDYQSDNVVDITEVPDCAGSERPEVQLTELRNDRLLLSCNGNIHVFDLNTNPATPSSTATSTPSPSRTPPPSPTSTSSLSASASPQPRTCESDGATCRYPILELAYPRVAPAWYHKLDQLSQLHVSTLGFVRPVSANNEANPQQLLISEVLRPAFFEIQLPSLPSPHETLGIACTGHLAPWAEEELGNIAPLRFCVLQDEQLHQSLYSCKSELPYSVTYSTGGSPIRIGVNIRYSSLKAYTQLVRSKLAWFWDYSPDQQELLHSSKPPLPLDFQIRCTVESRFAFNSATSAYPKYPTFHSFPAIPVLYLPVAFPVLSDIYVEHSPGRFRSSVDGTVLNLSQLMPHAPCTEEEMLQEMPCDDLIKSSDSLLSSVTDFVRSFNPSPKSKKQFELTLTGETDLIIVADRSAYRTQSNNENQGRRMQYLPNTSLFGEIGQENGDSPSYGYFDSDTVVYVGNVPSMTNWVSSDGMVMSVTTPPFNATCSSDDCGNLFLSIVNNGFDMSLDDSHGLGVQMEAFLLAIRDLAEQGVPRDSFLYSSALNTPNVLFTSGLNRIPFGLTCPPACPQNWTHALQASNSEGPYGSGSVDIEIPAALLYGLVLPIRKEPAMSPLGQTFLLEYFSERQYVPLGFNGISYVTQCVGDYTDVTSGVCTMANNPASLDCSWGQRDYCKKCPSGALCPGGFRMWPRKGYWVSHEATMDGIAYPCSNPDASTRCPGWPLDCDPEDSECAYLHEKYILYGTFPCGRGYRTGSKYCGQCDKGYYPTSQGTCDQCPSATAWNTLILPLLYFFIGILLIGIVIFLILFAVAKKFGGEVSRLAKGTVQFLLWTWISLQTVVQVTRSLEAGAPAWLSYFFSKLSVLQFEGIVSHPHCLVAIPYQTQWSQYIVIAILFALLASLSFLRARITYAITGDSLNQVSTVVAVKDVPLDGQAAKEPANEAATDPKKALVIVSNISNKLISIVLTLLLLLYATVTNSALGLISCHNTDMTIRAYFSIDNDGSTAYSQYSFPSDTWQRIIAAVRDGSAQPPSILRALDLPLQVQTMRTDAYRVCYESSHFPVAVVSWFVLFLYSIGYPLFTLFAIRSGALKYLSANVPSPTMEKLRRAWLPFLSLSRIRDCVKEESTHKRLFRMFSVESSSLSSTDKHPVVIQNPLASARDLTKAPPVLDRVASTRFKNPQGVDDAAPDSPTGTNTQLPISFSKSKTAQEKETPADQEIDRMEPMFIAHPYLKPLMTGSYRPSMYLFMQLDKVVLLILGAVSSLTYESTHVPSRVIGLLVAATSTLLAAVCCKLGRPFPTLERWKSFVKIYLYVLTSFSLIVNFIIFVVYRQDSFDKESSTTWREVLINILSVLSFILCIGLFVTLILAYLLTMIRESIRTASPSENSPSRRSRGFAIFSQAIKSTAGTLRPNGCFSRLLSYAMSKFYSPAHDEVDVIFTRSNRAESARQSQGSVFANTNFSLLPQGPVASKQVISGRFSLDVHEKGGFSRESTNYLAPLRIRNSRFK